MAQHIRDLGSFESIQQVWTALPGGGMEGDYLTINGNPFAWNKFIRQWQNDTTVINNPARETQTHDGDMNIGNDARIGGNLVVIGNIINDSIKNGLSAFELAVKGGYQGTEEQWLNSLIGKSAYQIWLEQAGNAGKGIEYFLAWMKDTKEVKGPKYIEDEALIDTVNDRMTIFYVNNGTSYKVVFVDETGGKHVLANRIGDITNYAGIYDVSADNELDGGILKTYGSLSEAIADIDKNAKNGGMTIKFIQRTGADAKYVQYRLLRTTFPSEYSADDWVRCELHTENYNKVDFAILDKKGNAAFILRNGDIITKNFNSSKIARISTAKAFADFNVADKDGYTILEIDKGNFFIENFTNAPLKGKKVSFIGDSITTYEGYPGSNVPYYKESNMNITGMTSVDKTWWKSLCDKQDAVVNRIYAYGGGDVATNLCLHYNELYSNGLNGNSPDVIFVLAGINDYGHAIVLGDIEDEVSANSTFYAGYKFLIGHLISEYPNATVVGLTLLNSVYRKLSIPRTNDNGDSIIDFCDAIKRVCDYYSCPYIDLNKLVNINENNYTAYLADYTHPNSVGASLIAKAIQNNIINIINL